MNGPHFFVDLAILCAFFRKLQKSYESPPKIFEKISIFMSGFASSGNIQYEGEIVEKSRTEISAEHHQEGGDPSIVDNLTAHIKSCT